MNSGLDRLVIRLVYVVRNGQEVAWKARKAVRLAHGIGIMLRPQAQGDFQCWTYCPFILRVQTEGIKSNGLCGPCVERLRKQSGGSRKETRLVFADNFSSCKKSGGIVGDVITAEIYAQLKVLRAVNF